MLRSHPIGTPGVPWTQDERQEWREGRRVRRSYADDVRARLAALPEQNWTVQRYGALPIEEDRYPLLCVHPREPVASLPWALVTGGVHGYETSGVHGALSFLEGPAPTYASRVNLVVAPCVSPWGYEVIHRWNPDAHDPNRSFLPVSPAVEAAALMAHVAGLEVSWSMHVDLHETTDSDETEFRPALAARDGKGHEPGHVPDGFYTVADSARPEPGFQRAIVHAVSEVTHIAPPDAQGRIIGAEVTQPGVIHYDAGALGLCMAMTEAPFRTTTEVYPDSPRATPEQCSLAQVTAVVAGLEYALAR
ncbi:MAG: M14 family metallocarboxypeptidase [Sandaracinaceae bacterium]